MSDVFDIIMLGYLDALDDANIYKRNKGFIITFDNQLKSKLYDIAYVKGYKDYFNYLKK